MWMQIERESPSDPTNNPDFQVSKLAFLMERAKRRIVLKDGMVFGDAR